MGCYVSALTAADGIHPLRAAAPWIPKMPRLRRHADRAVVLLGTASVVGEFTGGREAIDLGRRIGHSGPRLASVHRDDPASVVAVDHPQRIVGVDPEIVVIGVGLGHRLERSARIGRLHQPEVQDVDGVPVDGIRLYAHLDSHSKCNNSAKPLRQRS